MRLAVILRASRALERRGDAQAGDWRALAIGLSAGLTATLVANVFYLTMQFYYFYGVVLIVAAASALAVERVRRLAAMTDVSVVIVSYESRELLARCLAALAADGGRAADCEVIVVDQASSDGTAAWLAADHPGVRLVALEENVGFGAGNNRGAAVAGGRWLLLLNSDAFVRPGAIDELVRFAEAAPRRSASRARACSGPTGACSARAGASRRSSGSRRSTSTCASSRRARASSTASTTASSRTTRRGASTG